MNGSQGDTDADTDVDNDDVIIAVGNFTGPGSASAPVPLAGDPSAADLVYDFQTGNVTIDSSEGVPGGLFTAYSLKNAAGGDDFSTGNYLGPFLGGTSTVSGIEISETNPFGGVGGVINLGNVLPTGLNLAQLTSFLTQVNYTGSLGSGVRQFELFVINIPEPSTLCLAIFCALPVLNYAWRRRHR